LALLLADPLAAARAQIKLSQANGRFYQGSTDELLQRMRGDLHTGQVSLFDDTTSPEIGVVAGYGSGKTTADCYKAIQLAILNPGFYGAVLEPTQSMVDEIWLPKFEEVLERLEIPYSFHRGLNLPKHTLHFDGFDSYVVARSFENYRRIVGPDWAWCIGDEVDTVKTSIAFKAYKKCVGRIRVGRVQQKVMTSTPEGFGFHYQMFGSEQAAAVKGRRLIQMASDDNPHLPKDYFDEMEKNYTAEELLAYRKGQYVNLRTGRVWYKFNRSRNVRPVQYDPLDNEPLMLGADFNIGNTNGIVWLRRGREAHVLAEINAHDTEALGKEVRSRFPDAKIMGYPDSSGGNRSTNSSKTDVAILQEFGISNNSPKANPPVKDRINTTNAMFHNAKGEVRCIVDPSCTGLIKDLEQHCYDDNGNPDKDNGNDHRPDAFSYGIHRTFEVGRAITGKAVRGVRLY
jgi:hypothetical protein